MSDQPIAERSADIARAAAPVAGKPSVSLLDDPRVLGWGSVVLVLVAWELTAILTGVNRLYLPRPTQIVVALFDMFAEGRLAVDLGYTLYRIFAGFFIALVVGVALGIWIATSPRVRAVADMFIARALSAAQGHADPAADHLARHRRAVHAHHLGARRDLPDHHQHRARRAPMRSRAWCSRRAISARTSAR